MYYNKIVNHSLEGGPFSMMNSPSVTSSSPYGGSPFALSGLTGFDTSSVVQKLMQIESIPMQQIQQQEGQVQTVQGLWNQYNSLLTSFKTASDALGSTSLYQGTKATSSNSNEVSVSSTSGAGIGTYNINVLQMATAQVVQSTQQASTWTLGTSGSFNLNGAQVNVTSGMTLQQIASQINQTIGVGASASVVNNQLFLVNGTTGATGIQNVTDTNGILAGLGFNIAGGQFTGTSIQSAGKDARVSVFGQIVDQASNTFTNVINGVTFTINSPPTNSVTGTPPTSGGDTVSINVTSDNTALTGAVNNYVTAWNNINSFVKTNTAVNTSNSNLSGKLVGDTSLMEYQNQLVSAISNPVTLNPSSVYNSLASFGITFQQDGSLAIDNTIFPNALQSNLAAFQNLWTQPSTNPAGQVGLVAQMDSALNTLQNTATGILTSKLNGFTSQINDYNSQISNWQQILTQRQTQLTQQFTQMQITMQNIQSQSSAMMNMLYGSTSSSSTGF